MPPKKPPVPLKNQVKKRGRGRPRKAVVEKGMGRLYKNVIINSRRILESPGGVMEKARQDLGYYTAVEWCDLLNGRVRRDISLGTLEKMALSMGVSPLELLRDP